MNDLQYITEVTSLSAQTVSQALKAFPWDDQAKYAQWLAQTYYYVRHSTRLLAAAAARFPLDPTGDRLHVRFGKHIGEERSHEKLAQHDLSVLGVPPATLPEMNSTRMFYETQYYKIEHVGPTALYGYILMLEATGPACGDDLIQQVEVAHGPKCASFLRLHTSEDVDHVQKAIELVAQLPPQEQSPVIQNLGQSAQAYVGILQEIWRTP
jgi:pyrroloquinoline quinone (PQQ) biosynthesis protein C